jgi:hypothetical protein
MKPCKPHGNDRRATRSGSSMPLVRVSKAPKSKRSGGVASGDVVISAKPKRSHENTPLDITALPTDTVTVTDPTHPLYDLTLPLIGITTKQRLGRVCVVWLYPGVERVIPGAATTLAGPPPPLSPCRLSVAGIHTLLSVVASLADQCQENAYVKAALPHNPSQPTTPVPVAGTGPTPAPSSARRAATASRTTVDESLPSDTGACAQHTAAHHPGGAP